MVDEQVVLAGRCHVFFWTYQRLIANWTPREHQWPWVTALQHLADGNLRRIDTFRNLSSPQCEFCKETERKWIEASKEPYLPGYRISPNCKNNCPKTHKLLIPAWPGSGKTNTVIQWLTWLIGKDTALGYVPQVGLVSYADDVAAIRSVAVRDTIEFDAKFKFAFPTAIPQKSKGWGQDEWFLQREDQQKKDSTFRAAGMSGGILAYRFPTATVIDDPHNPKLVKTPGQREEDWRIYQTAIKTRGAQGVTPTVAVMNRFASDDFAGRAMAVENDWAVLHTPACGEDRQTRWPPEVVNGEPMGISSAELETLERSDRLSFETQYLVNPPSQETSIFRYFKRGPRPHPQEVSKVVQFWDTATTQKSWSDYSAMCEFWLLHNGQAYLANVINKKLGPGELIEEMEIQQEKALEVSRNVYLYVESFQAGSVFTEMLYAKTALRARDHEPGGFGKGSNKRGPKGLESRAAAVALHVEQGSVILPYTEGPSWQPWLDAFETQVKDYDGRKSGTDDMVAAFVGGIEVLFPHRFVEIPKIEFVMKGW